MVKMKFKVEKYPVKDLGHSWRLLSDTVTPIMKITILKMELQTNHFLKKLLQILTLHHNWYNHMELSCLFLLEKNIFLHKILYMLMHHNFKELILQAIT